jgi:hypothetical protein
LLQGGVIPAVVDTIQLVIELLEFEVTSRFQGVVYTVYYPNRVSEESVATVDKIEFFKVGPVKF